MIKSQCRICGAFISAQDSLLYDGRCYDCHYNPYANQEQKEDGDESEGV
jgi:hypothetical protein